jgi:hypothetical protein
LVTRGVTWPNDIFLAYPNNRSQIDEFHASFQVDWRSVQKAEGIVKQSGYNPDTDHVIETYVGRFVTYLDLESRGNPASLGGSLGFGFGPIGLDAPAQLLVKSVKDVVVVPGKKP